MSARRALPFIDTWEVYPLFRGILLSRIVAQTKGDEDVVSEFS